MHLVTKWIRASLSDLMLPSENYLTSVGAIVPNPERHGFIKLFTSSLYDYGVNVEVITENFENNTVSSVSRTRMEPKSRLERH